MQESTFANKTETKNDISVDLEKAKQVMDVNIIPARENQPNTYQDFNISVKGVPIGSFSVSRENGVPHIEGVNIVHPTFREKGYVTAAYMAFALAFDTDLEKGSNNTASKKIWDSFDRRHLIEGNTLKVDRVRKHLGAVST